MCGFLCVCIVSLGLLLGLWFGDYGLGIVFLSFRMGKHNGLRL